MSIASQAIRAALIGCLPPGVPPSFVSILSARRQGKTYLGELLMFDARKATVEITNHGDLRSHRWTDLPGGSVSFEAGRWIRCDDLGVGLPPQGELPLTQPHQGDPAHDPN